MILALKAVSLNAIEKEINKINENIQKIDDIPQINDIKNDIMSSEDFKNKIQKIFSFLTSNRDYFNIIIENGEQISVEKNGKSIHVPYTETSTGQKVCMALATMIASFTSNEKAPNFLILDEPVANLDDMHLLNLLDVLRILVLNGTQIFFTTANENVAKLFCRKFSFLSDDFKEFEFVDSGKKTEIIIK